ncbi:50S ribosomal protein L9 [Treponema endosymbiont of Eucomonympha sp.]|uniref:50S ribosomal protein L9 n=1 Tax=Treponema endosymbiont of Eucomonympha sp. TaxID=1580831 RepID=UPI0007514E9E|nr:50S ribosomal protein L9 [Treponema endosymbiont of Eucomonympha sp.]
MKVILNQDVEQLGEEGEVKNVANGYARNYLFPRKLAVLYSDRAAAVFEARKSEIEARRQAKRTDASSLKSRLEELTLELSVPVGRNGKLYGAVTNHMIAEELGKRGFEIEQKRIELPGTAIKHTGRYTVTIRLYESAVAEMPLVVRSQSEARPSLTGAQPPKQAAQPKSATENTDGAQAE